MDVSGHRLPKPFDALLLFAIDVLSKSNRFESPPWRVVLRYGRPAPRIKNSISTPPSLVSSLTVRLVPPCPSLSHSPSLRSRRRKTRAATGR